MYKLGLCKNTLLHHQLIKTYTWVSPLLKWEKNILAYIQNKHNAKCEFVSLKKQ